MRTTISLDDELLKDAKELSGIAENGPLVRAALVSFIRQEAARRLILLGGSDPGAKYIPRRRSEVD